MVGLRRACPARVYEALAGLTIQEGNSDIEVCCEADPGEVGDEQPHGERADFMELTHGHDDRSDQRNDDDESQPRLV